MRSIFILYLLYTLHALDRLHTLRILYIKAIQLYHTTTLLIYYLSILFFLYSKLRKL